MWNVREVGDRSEILARLESDRLYAAYAIGDLEPDLFAQCRWWLAEEAGRQERWAQILLFSGLEPPALFCMGEPVGVAAALDRAPLPTRVYLTARPEHWRDVEDRYHLRFANPMLRMVLDAARFRPVEHPFVCRLGPSDVDRLQELYDHGEDDDVDGYAPFQLESGVFHGMAEREGSGTLVSAAGTHLVAASYGLAALGNVFTHPDHRGRGYATACTSAVTSELARRGLEVVLNVAEANTRAVAVYRRLGYRDYCRFVEGVGHAVAAASAAESGK
jgi:ribosomal protein S18 acetylase RimI-like enzyme